MRRLLTAILIAATALTASAQSSIKVSAPNLVALDEQFSVTFTISGEAPSDFQWEVPSDFRLVWGPQKGSSTSISIVNGKHSRSSQTTYSYVLLPKSTGKFTLPQAFATVKGDRVASKAHSIEVVSNGAKPVDPNQGGAAPNVQSRGQAADPQSNAARTGTVGGDDLFLRLSLSKTSAVVGETLTATLKLYQRVNISGFEDIKFPAFNGFWSQELQSPTSIEFRRESVGDIIYNAAVLRSWTLIPQQSGDIKIDPAEMVCLVNVRTGKQSGSIFDSFFQEDYQTIRKRLSTPAQTVHVRPVPAGAPASFGGGVGSFRMSAGLTRDSLQTHDAASLKVTVTGKGNLSLLSAPDIVFPPDFEVYDVKTTDTRDSRIFEYPFIPRSSGEFTIGPVEYSYYDIAKGSYVTLRSPEMPIKVSRSPGDAVAPAGSGQLIQPSNRKDVKDLGSDIRFISTGAPKLSRTGSFFVASPGFLAATILLLLLAAALYFAFRSIAARRADVVGSKNRTATKMARKRLSAAKDFLGRDLYTAFYEELHKALLGFVSDKFNLDAAEMSRENIAARLSEAGVREESVSAFIGLLEACEFARYAPDSGHEAMNAHYESALSVISSIDDNMKRKTRIPGAGAAILALLLTLPFTSGAADRADSLWTAGVAAYTEGRWDAAQEAWESILATGESSAVLYYNIGNACFKRSDLSHAILNYEKALKLDPSYADARYNLEFANSMIQDRIENVPEFFLKTGIRNASRTLSSGAWAVLFLIFLAGTLALLLFFLLSSRTALRKAGFFGGIACALLAALCLGFSLGQRRDCLTMDKAIVTASVSPVKSAPGGGSVTDLFVLHEGTKVSVLSEVGEWCNIELSDGRQGWIRHPDIEIF